MDWNTLDNQQRFTLIEVAIADKCKRRAHWNNKRFKTLAGLGLLAMVSQGKVMNTYQLTEAGAALVLSAPEDYRRNFFPVPADMVKAKANAQQLYPAGE